MLLHDEVVLNHEPFDSAPAGLSNEHVSVGLVDEEQTQDVVLIPVPLHQRPVLKHELPEPDSASLHQVTQIGSLLVLVVTGDGSEDLVLCEVDSMGLVEVVFEEKVYLLLFFGHFGEVDEFQGVGVIHESLQFLEVLEDQLFLVTQPERTPFPALPAGWRAAKIRESFPWEINVYIKNQNLGPCAGGGRLLNWAAERVGLIGRGKKERVFLGISRKGSKRREF